MNHPLVDLPLDHQKSFEYKQSGLTGTQLFLQVVQFKYPNLQYLSKLTKYPKI